MKVIGTVNRDCLLVQISRDEMANLLGFYYEGSASEAAFKVGAEIKVSEMYRQLHRLRDAQRELKTASQTLHSIANLMLMADPLIQAIVDPEKAKEEAS